MATLFAAPALADGVVNVYSYRQPDLIKPVLDAFTAETGIEVNYVEAIQDNQDFFGTIQPALAQGQDTGWDLITVTDWLVGKMIALGYLEQIDVEASVPNFVANAADKYKNPSYDPNNLHSVPWQSGITGIGYNPQLTGREITSFEDLLDPAFEGRICNSWCRRQAASCGSTTCASRRAHSTRPTPWR
jgi:spermidine/putrescine transport system substrate-binding protein